MSEKVWLIGELIKETKQYFVKYGVDSPRLDTELLLCHVLNKERIDLYINFDQPIEKKELDLFRSLVVRRAKGIPLAYILEEKVFFKRPFYVNESVLIPRPETELLAENIINYLKDKENPCFIDLGTGSGALAVSILCEVKNSKGVAVDISNKALFIAKKNAEKFNVTERIDFLESDLFDNVKSNKFDLIVSNPPYIRSEDIANLSKEVKTEPLLALDGGVDGLECYRRIIKKAPYFLKKTGLLALEIGYDQAKDIIMLGEQAGFSFKKIIKDYAGLDRMVFFAGDDFLDEDKKAFDI